MTKELRVRGWVRRLRQAGVRPAHLVAVCDPKARTLADLWAAVRQVGAAFLPLDPALPTAMRSGLLRQAGADFLLAGPGLRRLRSVRPTAKAGSAAASVGVMIATSGSSGWPKLVMLGQAAMERAAWAANQRLPLRAGDRWLVCLPLFHVGGMAILYRCQQAPAQFRPQPQPVLLDAFQPQAVWQALHEQGITHLSLVPTMLHRLLPFGPPPPRLRHVLVGGAALDPALAARAAALGWPLRPTYGMTECGSQCLTLDHFPADWQAGQVGTPLTGLRIVCPPDGRLRIGGHGLMLGYANPRRRGGDGVRHGLFQTQDLGYRRPDGQWIIEGRADQMILCGGKNIPPHGVERLLSACPGVQQAVVVGVPDPEWGQVVAAAYVGTAEPGPVRDWMRQHGPAAWCPKILCALPHLPLTGSGKPDRVALRHMAARMAVP